MNPSQGRNGRPGPPRDHGHRVPGDEGKAHLSPVATTATWLPRDRNRSDVATVAGNGVSDSAAKRSHVASVAAPLERTAGNDRLRDAIEERAGLAADRVPPAYLDAWARLNHQKPFDVSEDEWRQALDDGGRFLDAWARINHQKPATVSEAEWRLAIDDGGRFLDAWGGDAATMRWTPGEWFDVPRDGRQGGLVWQLKGERVDALGDDRARLEDGRAIKRGK
jgi:hypothetical protein